MLEQLISNRSSAASDATAFDERIHSKHALSPKHVGGSGNVLAADHEHESARSGQASAHHGHVTAEPLVGSGVVGVNAPVAGLGAVDPAGSSGREFHDIGNRA